MDVKEKVRVMLLTFIARGGRRSGELEEVVVVALPPSPTSYLAHRSEKRARSGEMDFPKSVGGWGRNKGAFWQEVTQIFRPTFSLMRGSSRHHQGRNSLCKHWCLLALGRQYRVWLWETAESRIPLGPGPKLLWHACHPRHGVTPVSQSTILGLRGSGWTPGELPIMSYFTTIICRLHI
jgi:hypothetical protein